MKASDVSEEKIFSACDNAKYPNLGGASRWEIGEKLPEYPAKIILAKLRKMVKQKKISGCACGCSGHFQRAESR